jgi:hypothetical protein
MAIPEACGLWIEQRVQEEMEQRKETGNSLREIGRQIAAEVEKIFETKVKPETIYQKARRGAGGTNVPEAEKATAAKDLEEIKEIKQAKDGTYRGGSRPGAGRKRSKSYDDAIMDKLKEINQAIESGDISNKALETTRNALNKRVHDPQVEQEFVEQQPKKSRLRLLDDRLCGVIDELRYFADGKIEQEDGDHVWVKAIGMKGPDFICQFHKLGIDLNQVYCTLIDPGKNLDLMADGAQAEATGGELDRVNAATDIPDQAADVQKIQAADNDTAQGDDLEDIKLDTALVNSEQDQAGDGDTALGDQEPEIDDAAGANQKQPDTQVNKEPNLAQASDDAVTDDTVQATTKTYEKINTAAAAEPEKVTENLSENDTTNDQGEQDTALVDPEPDAAGGDLVEPAALVDTDTPVDEPDPAEPAQGEDDLIPDCTGREIPIEERNKYLLLVAEKYPGRSNAQARVDLLNRKGIPVYVKSRQYPYGGEWTGKKFRDNLKGAKQRLEVIPEPAPDEIPQAVDDTAQIATDVTAHVDLVPESVQITDDPQDLPVIPEQEAVSTPASQIEKDQAVDTNQGYPVTDDTSGADQIEPTALMDQEPETTTDGPDPVAGVGDFEFDSTANNHDTAQADPAPNAQAHVDVVEPAREIQADDTAQDVGELQADAAQEDAGTDDTAAMDLEALVPDCRDRKITIEEKDQIILTVYAELPGPKNAQTRVDLVNKKGVPAKVDPLSQYGGEFKVSSFNNAVIGAKKREAKRQAAQVPQD